MVEQINNKERELQGHFSQTNTLISPREVFDYPNKRTPHKTTRENDPVWASCQSHARSLQDLRIRSLVHEGQWNLYCTSRGGSTGRQAGLVTRLDFLNLTLASLYTDISIFNLSLKTQKNRTGTFFVKIIEPLAPVRFKNKEDKPSFFFLGQSETTSPHSNVPFRCSVAISLCLFTGWLYCEIRGFI